MFNIIVEIHSLRNQICLNRNLCNEVCLFVCFAFLPSLFSFAHAGSFSLSLLVCSLVHIYTYVSSPDWRKENGCKRDNKIEFVERFFSLSVRCSIQNTSTVCIFSFFCVDWESVWAIHWHSSSDCAILFTVCLLWCAVTFIGSCLFLAKEIKSFKRCAHWKSNHSSTTSCNIGCKCAYDSYGSLLFPCW